MGVRYLLDTHVLLWLWGDTERVPIDVRTSLADRSNELLVSAISGFEITTKRRLGKLTIGTPDHALSTQVERIGATALPVSLPHAQYAGSMAWSHRDPFDRVLVAQATLDDLVLVTVDASMTGLPVPQILSW
jgi:PIN domain nuclease of toxin-antitoxin system